MSSSRSLASLPDIVLRETMAYLLVDTLRARRRTAVLQTCSTLHGIGLPLLYKVVDLLGSFNHRLLRHADALFGRSGLLTAGGRIPGLAQSVVELRVGGSRLESGHVMGFDFVLGTVDLPRCTRLVIDSHTPLSSPLRSILPRLPIADLVIRYKDVDVHSVDIYTVDMWTRGPRRSIAHHLGTTVQPWRNLDRITYQEAILWDVPYNRSRLPLQDWSFRTLVFDLARWDFAATDALIGPAGGEAEPFLNQVERIELRVGAKEEKGFRSKVEKVRREKPVDLVRERILPLIVFVGPEGQERKLIE